MPRKTSFSRALSEANRDLKLAIKRRDAARKEVSALDVAIPALQQTIEALQAQLGKRKGYGYENTEKVKAADQSIPPELAKYLGPQDLSGIGSIPAQSGEPTRELTEDELLDLGDVK